ncbi:MAG: ATP-grasp domain-containing protein [Candidatus Aenigmarchaeota archaeon]|nr:ATP-grasp domain-containing protein [Candidatus Aenigmarchaeota archaeon]
MVKTIGFIYNVRHKYPDPNDPRAQLETDFDDPETIEWMIKHLEKIGFKVIAIEANEDAYEKLKKNKKNIDLVFNYSMGIYGRDRYAHLPAMLEMLQIPYTGPSPLSEALLLNKAKSREVFLARKIPTPLSQTFYSIEEELDKRMKFPLIVKPCCRGSSAGITNKSIVKNKDELKEQVEFIIKTFNEPALVQMFLSGREFSVPMLGNPPEFLPIIEVDHSVVPKGYAPIDSLEVKWIVEEQDKTFTEKHFSCPANIDKKLEKKIKEICLKVWDALELADLCRIDIRCDSKGNPYVLDVNSPPGLIPPEVSMTSYFPLAARAAGIDYDTLLKRIINEAAKRHNI